ncbi:MAG: ABC transporter permease [Gemmatimonadetes bacterium]|nr:ABC transporter permease [Gemmatimonadota bacterium]
MSRESAALRFYRWLLLLYPEAFRAEYGDEMLGTFAARYDFAVRPGCTRAGFWVREVVALLRATWQVRRRGNPDAFRLPPLDKKRSWDMSLLFQDFRIALRSLRKAPSFTIVAVATLALGIGSTTAIFSVINGVLFTPLDFDRPEELVTVWGEDVNYGQLPIATGDFRDIRDQMTTLEDISARYSVPLSLTGDGEPEEVSVAWTTSNHFSLLGIEPALGRVFTDDEPDAVVMSDGLWKRRYGADPDVIGRRIQLGGQPHTIVGILPAGINPNVVTRRSVMEHNDVWRLLRPRWLRDPDRINAWLRLVGRLKPGVTVAQAQEDMSAIGVRIAEVAQDNAHVGFKMHVNSMLGDLTSRIRPMLYVLMGSVTFVLLIACSNVANLLLVRGQARSHEMAVRAALGGGRQQLVRQMLVETGILALAGGVLGVGLASWGVSFLVAFQPTNLPRLDTIAIDMPVLLFALGGSFVAATLFGVVPAVRASRTDLRSALVERSASRTRRQQGASRVLIVSEVALSLVLLIGTGLLLRSFAELRKIRPGFDTQNILTVSVAESGRSETREAAATFFRRLHDELEALPGVTAVGYANRVPLGGGLYGGPWATEEIKARNEMEPEGSIRFVTSDYFNAMGTRLMAGRFFEDNEDWDVVIVDEKLAAMAWPGKDPIGQRLWTGALGRGGDWSRVVGVVEHQRHTTLNEDYNETLFFPMFQYFPGDQVYVVMKTSMEPAGIVGSVRATLRAIDSEATLARVRTIDELVGNALAPNQFALILIGIFAGVAVVLAGVGLYGVISYSVSQRTREIGVRIAFGAGRSTIIRLVLGQGFVLTGIGVGVGVVGAIGLTRVIGSMLVNVRPTDPATFAVVAALLVGIGLLGSYVPARRALRVDPMEALRAE